MVACAHTGIDPRTVVIVSFDAALAHVAVVTARNGHDLALKANLMHLKVIEKLCHCDFGHPFDEAWPT